MSLRQKFVASSLWSIVASIFDNLASLLTFVVLARLLTPYEFGSVAFAQVLITISSVVVMAGIPDALIRQVEWDDRLASTAFWANTSFGVLISLGIIVGVAPVLVMFHDRVFGLVLAVLSVTLVIEGLSAVHLAKLRRAFLHKMIARRQIASNLISSSVGVTLAFLGWGVWAMVASRTIAVAVSSIILWRASDFRPQRHFSMAELSQIGRFSGGVLGSQLLNQAGNQLPALFLGSLLGPAAIAQYRVGMRSLDLVVSLVISPIQSTAVSVLSQFANDRDGIGRTYSRLTRGCAAVACPILFGIAAVAPDFVRFAFGPQWDVAGHVLLAMCLIVGATTLGYFEAPTLNAAGQSDLTLLTSLVGSIGNIVAGLIGLALGPVGVAAALAIRAHVTMPFSLSLVYKATGIRPLQAVANIASPYIAAAGMFAVVSLIRVFLLDGITIPVRLALCIGLGVVTYPTIMMLFFFDRVSEIRREIAPMLPSSIRQRWI